MNTKANFFSPMDASEKVLLAGPTIDHQEVVVQALGEEARVLGLDLSGLPTYQELARKSARRLP
jgi:hypothetical protein